MTWATVGVERPACGDGSGRNRSLSARAPLPPHLGPRLRQSPCLQPSLYTGIAVVRLRPKPSHADSMAVTETLILTMVLVAGGFGLPGQRDHGAAVRRLRRPGA